MALLADMALLLLCQHKTDPDTAFLCRGWPTFPSFLLLVPEVCMHNPPKTSTYVVLSTIGAQSDLFFVDNKNTQQPTQATLPYVPPALALSYYHGNVLHGHKSWLWGSLWAY
jgi:hypothetical protein